MPNISRSKGNQTIKFGHLIEYNKRNIFLQNLCGKWSRETSYRHLFTFQKSLIWGKRKWSVGLVSICFNSPLLAYNKRKLYKTLDYWSRDMLYFDFSEKGLGLVSPSYFAYDISRKMFLMLQSIHRPNFIFWLPLLLEILGNMCSLLTRLWRHKIEIYLIFLIKPFCCMTKKSKN